MELGEGLQGSQVPQKIAKTACFQSSQRHSRGRASQGWLTSTLTTTSSWEWKQSTLSPLKLQRHGAGSSRRHNHHRAAFLHMLFTLLCLKVSKIGNPGWNLDACSSLSMQGCKTSWGSCFTFLSFNLFTSKNQSSKDSLKLKLNVKLLFKSYLSVKKKPSKPVVESR